MTDRYAAKKDRAAARRRRGLCRDCDAPAERGKSRCAMHQEANRVRVAKWRGEKANRSRRMVVARCACGLGITEPNARQCGFCIAGLTA